MYYFNMSESVFIGVRCPKCGSKLYHKRVFQFWSKIWECPWYKGGCGWKGDNPYERPNRHHHEHKHHKHHRRH